MATVNFLSRRRLQASASILLNLRNTAVKAALPRGAPGLGVNPTSLAIDERFIFFRDICHSREDLVIQHPPFGGGGRKSVQAHRRGTLEETENPTHKNINET